MPTFNPSSPVTSNNEGIAELQQQIDDLQSQIDNIGSGGNNDVQGSFTRILHIDPCWQLGVPVGWNSSLTRSWVSIAQFESSTGKIHLGTVELKQKLIMFLAGGGSTNGNSKIVRIKNAETGEVLIQRTLSQLLGFNTTSSTKVSIDTSAYSGTVATLELDDQSTDNEWAWMACDSQIYIEG